LHYVKASKTTDFKAGIPASEEEALIPKPKTQHSNPKTQNSIPSTFAVETTKNRQL
jgi:hypothetical protein